MPFVRFRRRGGFKTRPYQTAKLDAFASRVLTQAGPATARVDRVAAASRLLRFVCEISKIGWGLIFLGRHQHPVAANPIMFFAEDKVIVVFDRIELRPF